MHKRTDVRTPERMGDETTFESTDQERVPTAYFVPAEQKAAVELLRAHGIALERVATRRDAAARGVPRRVDSTTTPKPFENHQERTVTGSYAPVERAGAGRRLSRGDDAARWRDWPSTCSSRARTTAW